ncbi:small lysine-rich protein 1 [Dunckerocampus dactyliophorus]|uniref:small lysine-rich protein 1 n=1 Tax=Dunckerocampus dactyliophorus TaxID=161453 RepID=UPI002404BED6|nr:small lysine-rich protein 1 [Dunckerocampus dactyliophorus]XP_054656146.1 small lysine-rich protein 1 [Dunckerocampus dactyliophorus]
MATKSTKSRYQGSKPGKKTGNPKSGKKRSSSDKVTKKDVDVFGPAAMQNVYYIAHNAAACLEFRGYGWSKDKRKKGKKWKMQM